jgi:hypothetical protein
VSAETLINSAMLADAPLLAVVVRPGGNPAVDARVYPDFLTQDITLPAVVNVRVETEYVRTIHTGTPAGSKVTMDSYCMSQGRLASENLADLVETALAAADFLITARRPDFDEDTNTYITIVTSEVWL